MRLVSVRWLSSLGTLALSAACASSPNSPSPGSSASAAGAGNDTAGGASGGAFVSGGAGANPGGSGATAAGAGGLGANTGGSAGALTDAGNEDADAAPDPGVEEPVSGLPTLGTATIDETKPGHTVPDNFVGLSLEWSTGLTYLSDGKGNAMPATIGLFKNFDADGHRIDLRIGGNSTDKTWWTAGPGTQPAKQIVNVDSSFLSTFTSIHNQAGSDFILGVDLAVNDTTNPASFVKAALSAMPQGSISSFEIGNEPDLYSSNGWRSASYGFSDYQKDVDAYITALAPLVGANPLLTMPAFAGTGWFTQTKAILSAQESKLTFATLHNYPFSICGKATTDSTYPKLSDLLTDKGTSNVESTYAPLISATNALGLGLRMAEFNSIACGGAPGVSDTFAQALWSIDVLFRFAESNALGVNFHTSQDYPAFRYTNGVLDVLPLYYGMLMFSLGTAEKGQLIPVQVQTTGRVRAFATLGSDGAVRLVAINEDGSATGKLTVSLSKAHGVARISRLTAPMLSSKTGLSFEDRTFDGSTDGKPIGTRTRNTVTPSGTSYAFGLPPNSAAALVIPAL
jgi:hypothetical protein